LVPFKKNQLNQRSIKYNNKPLILNQPLTGSSLPAWLCGMAGLVPDIEKENKEDGTNQKR